MSQPEPEEVHAVLKDFEDPLMGIHLRAWDRLMSNPEWPTLVFSRTGTGLMHDLIVQEASSVLDTMPRVHKIEHDKSVRYLFADEVLLRFKHGSDRGLGSNVDTKANSDFIDADVELWGMPQVKKVELLWYENKLRTKLDRVEVTARDGKRRLWGYPMGSEPVTVQMPFDLPDMPPQHRAIPLVTVKTARKADSKD
ncbi:hypothetical protein RPMA_12560 [Tardiphaga alba]|uniref:Uncharacterized protein n=1 Tax=Tardiphaga alba TaxID=340268 RepID=A0ABX8A8E0_9BRAD|nr:hypothetical protein [Tardiphaga alba]QUS39576.1 hypothetical protein RPMA_12560 [Tardiphaga alba]